MLGSRRGLRGGVTQNVAFWLGIWTGKDDAKFPTYKLALLRVLVRIANSAPGMAEPIDDDNVGVPLGLVALNY